MSLEATASHLDIVSNTVRAHLSRNGAFIATVRAETEAAAAKCFAKKVQKLEDRADAKLSLAETKNEIRQKLYDGLLRRLKEEEAISEETFVKYFKSGMDFVDERPAQIQKRLTAHVEVHELGGETIERLERMLTGAGYLAPQPALPAPEAIEAVVVSDRSE
jgi:hypothetical protein